MKLILALFVSSCFIFSAAFSQSGYITGKVVDETTGEDLIGVAVVIKGTTKGVSTDIDGSYKLQLAPGVYDIQASYISYQTKVMSAIEVKAGESTALNITLKTSSTDLGEIVIETRADRETNTALVLEQKNSLVLFDGISLEQIKKTPDRNTADVLKRVSGATIQDNSFVIIRGLPDRYNAAYINGSPLPSSEPDRKAFAFDIFPSALLSDLKVIKTAMPSLPGEFAGGIIQIRTKDIPDQNYYNVSVGTSFNLITTFSDFRTSQNGSIDFLGFDDGTRTLPGGFPTNQEIVSAQNNFEKEKLVDFAKMLNNNYPIINIKAAPGLNLQFNMGHNINLIKKEKREMASYKSELGSVFAVTYNAMQTYRETHRADFNDVEQLVSYDDKQYNSNVNWGAIWNIAYLHSTHKGANNRISLKNLFNVNTNDQMIARTGQDLALDYDIMSYNMYYSQNTLFSTQLNGEHVLAKSRIKFEWGAGYSRLNRIIPDYRTLEYRRTLGDTTVPFSVPFSGSVQQDKAGRFFSTQIDNIFSGTFDFSYPFKIGATRHELKSGAYLQYKDRDFAGRQFGYTSYKFNGTDIPAISVTPIDSIFADRSFSAEGLLIKEVTRKSDTYISQNSLYAGYIQLEHAFFENRLKIVWGARLESYRQVLNTFNVADDSPVNIDTNVIDILPSINIIGAVHPQMNVRLSASQTVTRPEARELAPFAFFDYSVFALVSGNPNLSRTRITNVDLRYEWYPAGGQNISVTGFFKWFESPIEKILFPGLSSGRKFSYINVPGAYCAGVELEYRFTIGSFIKKMHSRFLDGLALTGNFAYIHSEVNLDSVVGVSERRPMQGQSPFIINAGVQYNDTKYDFGVSLSVNYIGRRIFSVGDVTYPEIWENPRLVMDLQLTKLFLKKKLELRLNFKDLLAQNAIMYQDNDRSGSFSTGDNKIMDQRLGQQISFSLGYKF